MKCHFEFGHSRSFYLRKSALKFYQKYQKSKIKKINTKIVNIYEVSFVYLVIQGPSIEGNLIKNNRQNQGKY